MSGPYDRSDREELEEAGSAQDREISLGTGAMLGIFLALVVVCGAFFGFGYSMGHKTVPLVAGAVGDAGTANPAQVSERGTLPADAGAISARSGDGPAVVLKPSAGSSPVVSRKVPPPDPATTDRETSPTEAPVAKTTPKLPVAKPAGVPPPVAAVTSAAVPTASSSAAAAPVSSAAASAPGAALIYVQISAVSHQEDAQLLMSALKRRGYDATVRHAPQDQLLHVQLGPYPTKKEADAMRQRLSADGYNAILK